MTSHRNYQAFDFKILAKPRQMELLDERLTMMKAKSESIKTEFNRIRGLFKVITDESHLRGLEGTGKPTDA